MNPNLDLPRIFVDADQLTRMAQTTLELTPQQHHYFIRVLRLRSGDQCIVQTHQGQRWLSQVKHFVPDRVQNTDSNVRNYSQDYPQDRPPNHPSNHSGKTIIQLLEPLPALPELPVNIILLAALPKTGFDDVVRQATELGVSQIMPVLSQRTLLKPSAQKYDRWQRIAQEAAEQCERRLIPTIHPPRDYATSLTPVSSTAHRYICVARNNAPLLLTCLQSQLQMSSQVAFSFERLPEDCPTIVLATGPEGGWTPEEVDQALRLGYQSVSLGPLILRSVTAPLAATALVMGVMEVMRMEVMKNVGNRS